MDWVFAILISALVAIVPTMVYVLLVYWLDRYEKEPAWLLAAAFIWGAVPAIILSLILELALGIPWSGMNGTLAYAFIQSSLIAPLVEESVKGLALLGLLFLFRAEFDDVLDGVIYGALIGFGFAMTEHFFYLLGAFEEGGMPALLSTALLRIGIFGFTHAFFTALTGAGIGYARNKPSGVLRWMVPLLAFGSAVGFHFLHNFGATLATQSLWGLGLSLGGNAAGILIVVFIVIASLNQENRWIARELQDEIGVSLTEEAYEMIIRRRLGLACRMEGLACALDPSAALWVQWRRLAMELALKKAQYRAGDHRPAIENRIAALQEEMRQYSVLPRES